MPPISPRQRAIRALRCRELPSTRSNTTYSRQKFHKSWTRFINSLVWPKLQSHEWVVHSNDKSLSSYITGMILHGDSEQSVRRDLTLLVPGLKEDDEQACAFVRWIFSKLNIVVPKSTAEAAARWAKQPARNLKELPALRLHIVGCGKVGKNYSTRTPRDTAHARARPRRLAKALIHGCVTHSNLDFPAFITRAANGLPCRHDCDTVQLFAEPARRTLPLEPNSGQHTLQRRTYHLLCLPAELRNAIYEYSFDHHTDSNGEVNLLTEPPPSSALTLTCKQVHRETKLMHRHKTERFWHKSSFFVDSKSFPTGFHVRPQLLRCQAPEWKDISNLRITLNAEVGVFDVFMEKYFWLAKQRGGLDSSGLGIGGVYYGGVATTAGEDITFWRDCDDQRPHREFDFELDDHAVPSTFQDVIDELTDGTRERIPLAGQICAVMETFAV